MSEESSFVGLNASQEIISFSRLDSTMATEDSPFKDLRNLTKSLNVEGTDVVYFEEIVRGSLEENAVLHSRSRKPKKKKSTLDELKVFYAESPVYRNTMRVELKVLKNLQVPSAQDASGLIQSHTDLEHSVEKRLGVLAEEKMMENFPLNDAFNRSKMISKDKEDRSTVPGCKGSYCEYVFNAMSLLAKKSFSKSHSQVPHHRAILFQIPRKWRDQDTEDMLLAIPLARQMVKIEEFPAGVLIGERLQINDATVLPLINKSASCVGLPIKQKKSKSPADFMHCRSSAASYDVLTVCENCFKIYGALHNIKKHQEYQKKHGKINADQISGSTLKALNPKLMSPLAKSSGSLMVTPEQRKLDFSTGSAGVFSSPKPETTSPNQNAPSKSTSPINRSKRKTGIFGTSMQSDASEILDPPTVDMDWRIKNFHQKQAAGLLDAGANFQHIQAAEMQDSVARQDNDSEIHPAEDTPDRDIKELTHILRQLMHRKWDDQDFQRDLRNEKYDFEICKNLDGTVAVLVLVENELKLMTAKDVLGMMAVNLKMPGFVNFRLLKPTYNDGRKKALAEAAKLRAKTMLTTARKSATVPKTP